ncbi:MAG: dTMP kinase [Betaproteobacteria bacterium]|nr:dTMP kinase [Betaproteobacteria bacterium]MDH3436940.1 dTMP kinase [Betaproteobacteria bacterium]
MRGRFITLEGIDGAGKSTHLEWLAHFLGERGIRVTVTREPGGTALGERLRELVLHGEAALHPETETLLMFAARCEHIDKVIEPALASGAWVICDRFTDATYAYQSGGSGVSWSKIAQLEQWTQDGLQPDTTVLFDVAPDVGLARAARGKSPDRFERERAAFYERARQAYLERAREAPHRVHVVDANRPVTDIHKTLEGIFSTISSI